MGIDIELKAIENFVKCQEKTIKNLKDIIQEKNKEIKMLKDLIIEIGGSKNE